ncbi:hypothetical protein EHS25_001628 [Saitozyma podzolica]|uniref:C2H2-type domain-containing protein n=1 Tax=Saitozyma podzolica TaxID=1890683 RepID=A0A427YH81_9TREE|nr:hypothetical protein EHS25_001628 [Saitozyma podzolica]
MSLSATTPITTFPFTLPGGHKSDPSVSDPTLSFPSPPASIAAVSDSGAGFDFDLDSTFTHCSPGSSGLFDDNSFNLSSDLSLDLELSAADLSPIASAPSPTSTTLISPKSSISLADVGPGPLSSIAAATPTTGPEAEALSNHHLQRYFHYKALAAQAEAEVNALAAIQNEPFEALLAGFSMPDPSVSYKDESNNNNMLAYQTQPSQSFYGVGAGVPQQGYSFSYQPQQAASMHHAQAQAHLQAHDAAARAAVAVQQQPRASLGGYFVPASNRSSFDVGPPQSLWSRASLSSQQSAASPPFPSTPNYTTQQMMAPPAPALAHAQYMAKSASTSSMSMTRPIQPPSLPLSEGENELEDELEDDDESMGQATLDGMPMTNLHGGGRGYVPGKTPDDPKKRHKCNLCGRGFARAFNLKSHIQTHNPLRPKPHMCPHPTCKRGFSRLHDLERHRQGIHSDGPLVDAKRQGVAPSVARAQGRIQRRAENGGLI